MSHGHSIAPLMLGAALAFGAISYVRGDDSHLHLTTDTKMASQWYGCVVLEDAKRIDELVFTEHDNPAMIRFYRPREDLGVCKKIEAGTRVAVERREDRSPDDNSPGALGNWYKIRPYGDPTSYWVSGIDVFGKAY